MSGATCERVNRADAVFMAGESPRFSLSAPGIWADSGRTRMMFAVSDEQGGVNVLQAGWGEAGLVSAGGP